MLTRHKGLQLQQGRQRHARTRFLQQAPAVDGVEHPTRKGELKSRGNFDRKNSFPAPPNTNHFYFRPVKWMVPVMDFLPRGLMSSVRRRCLGHPQAIWWPTGSHPEATLRLS